MPAKHFAAFLGLWVAIVLVAWLESSVGNGLYAYVPGGNHYRVIDPPNSLFVFISLFLIGGCILFTQIWAVWFSFALGVGLILGCVVGLLGTEWTPGIGQYAVTGLTAGLTYYGFKLRDYLD